RHRREDGEGVEVAVEDLKQLRVTEFITVGELANLMEVKPQEVLQACLDLGIMATINRRLDKDALTTVADEFGYRVEFVTEMEAEDTADEVDDPARMVARPPVVTVMGHVDHGRTWRGPAWPSRSTAARRWPCPSRRRRAGTSRSCSRSSCSRPSCSSSRPTRCGAPRASSSRRAWSRGAASWPPCSCSRARSRS